MTGPKVEIREVSREFVGRKRTVLALDRASLTLGDNEFVSLVGTTGCGKSTLLSIVAGLQEPTAGEVLVDGRRVEGPGRDRGVVFQTYTLFPWLTALENVEFALREESLSRADRRARALEQLQLVGLEQFADSHPNQLSGGMKQRVAIARALSYRPEILLMDEPFGALDALTRQLMQELLTRVWERHRLTVLFVTHDVDEAVYISDRVIVMTNRPGRVKAEIPVALPRPRSYDMISSPEFAAMHGQVLDAIREESLAAAGLEGAIR
jgi:NitT/TauT family transport system ATP-binding protein